MYPEMLRFFPLLCLPPLKKQPRIKRGWFHLTQLSRQRRSWGTYYDQGPRSKVAVCCTCWLEFVTHPTHVGVGCSRVDWLKSNNRMQIDTISSVVTWSPFVSSVSCDYPENDPQWPDLKSKVALKSHQFTIAIRRCRCPIPATDATGMSR